MRPPGYRLDKPGREGQTRYLRGHWLGWKLFGFQTNAAPVHEARLAGADLRGSCELMEETADCKTDYDWESSFSSPSGFSTKYPSARESPVARDFVRLDG